MVVYSLAVNQDPSVVDPTLDLTRTKKFPPQGGYNRAVIRAKNVQTFRVTDSILGGSELKVDFIIRLYFQNVFI